MKVFLDECVDWRFSRHITAHEVKSARDMGWSGLKNGALLSAAAQQFDVFVTVDRNLSFQQNTANFEIAVVVLQAHSNRLADLAPPAPKLVVLESLSPGSVTMVSG